MMEDRTEVRQRSTVPRLEAIILLAWLADIHIFELEGCLERHVGYGHDVLVARLAEPS
jgi:hypothetical protein